MVGTLEKLREDLFESRKTVTDTGMSIALLSIVVFVRALLKRPTEATMPDTKPPPEETRHCKLEFEIHAVDANELSRILTAGDVPNTAKPVHATWTRTEPVVGTLEKLREDPLKSRFVNETEADTPS